LCASTVLCRKLCCLSWCVLSFFVYKEAVCDSYLTEQVNMAQETLKGLLANWLRKRKQRMGSPAPTNGELLPGKDIGIRSHTPSTMDASSETNAVIYPPFQFSDISPPSFITEGTHGGPWRRKITLLDGTEDEKYLPGWCLDCVLNNRLPFDENTK